MFSNNLLKIALKSNPLGQWSKLGASLLFRVPTMKFSDQSNKFKQELQGDSPFEISSSRQMMIADKKITKGESLPKIRYNDRSRNKSSSTNNKTYTEDFESQIQPTANRNFVKKQKFEEKQLPKKLSSEQVQDLLPEVNSVRNYYKVLDEFSEQNFVDVFMNEKIINDPKYALALNNMWTYSRKFRIMNTYQTPQFQQIATIISENLDNLQGPEGISGFSFNLYKVNYQEVDPYIKIEQYVLERLDEFSLKALAQIAYSFSKISRSQTNYDFSHFYGKMQLVLALKLRDAIVDPELEIKQLQKDYTQILTGFSKSQNISKEFLYVLEQFIINHISYFEPREKSSTLYTFAANDYFSKPLLEICRDDFIKNFEAFNIQEMSHILVSLDKFDMLDEEVMKIVKQQFMLKKTQINLLDLADICMVFFKREYVDEEFYNIVRDTYRALRQNTDSNILSKLLTNASTLLNKELMPHRFFKTLMQSLQIISDTKELKGRLIDQLKKDALKILHPQFKQQYMDTLNNMKQLNYKEMKEEIKQKTKDKKYERTKKHYQIERKNKERDERAKGNKDQKLKLKKHDHERNASSQE
ncbi:hypothetical protein ABPG72_007843 [Tetrahymena utriculariae]